MTCRTDLPTIISQNHKCTKCFSRREGLVGAFAFPFYIDESEQYFGTVWSSIQHAEHNENSFAISTGISPLEQLAH